METSYDSHPESRFDGQYIHFKISKDGITAHCAVTVNYLERLAARNGLAPDSFRATFALHRAKIEALALSKLLDGEARPLLTAYDLGP